MTTKEMQHALIGNLVAGIQDQSPDIIVGERITQLPLTTKSYNWSYGKRVGLTTRYGIMPVAGHASKENGDTVIGAASYLTGRTFKGLTALESGTTQAPNVNEVYGSREHCYGCMIVQLPVGQSPASTPLQTRPVAYWINTSLVSTGVRLDLCPSSDVSASTLSIVSNFEAGIGYGTATPSYVDNGTEINKTLRSVDRLHTSDLAKLREINVAAYASYLPLFMRWTSLQTVLDTNIVEFAGKRPAGDEGTSWQMDLPAAPETANFTNIGHPYWIDDVNSQKRPLSIATQLGDCDGTDFTLRGAFRGFFSTQTSDMSATPSTDHNATGGSLLCQITGWDGVTAGGGVYINPTYYNFFKTNDFIKKIKCTVFAATLNNKAYMVLFNPNLRNSANGGTPAAPLGQGSDFAQWVDPTNNFYKPLEFNTTTLNSDVLSSGSYTEKWSGVASIAKQTCWRRAPVFIHGTATGNVVAAAVNSGGLKAKTVYEYAFSIYNALTGKESNVGVPAKAFVDADGSSIIVHHGFKPLGTAGSAFTGKDATKWSQFPTIADLYANYGANTQAAVPKNYLSYRIYYREVGSFEWLFSQEVTFASLYHNPFSGDIYIGSDSAIGLPGGQVGGYVDNSDLPVDEYIDVTGFQDRLFWLTKGMLRWSSADNVFVYSIRNYAACPGGEFRGMLTHYFSGQAQQDGRLVVFGSEGTYDIRRTDQFQYQQVRVSASAPPVSVPLEGSDLVVNIRGSDTAFSGRCACVAEGILYFWGATGIFRDDGVGLPVRISSGIEPTLFENYNRSKTDEFFAYYNKRSREVLFFYRPKTIDATLGYKTLAWVYSIRTEMWPSTVGAWSQYGYKNLINWAQDLELTGFETPAKIGGTRTLIGQSLAAGGALTTRVSRPFFHDDDCDCGDFYPTGEMMVYSVKTIEIPPGTPARLRFTLTLGSDGNVFTAAILDKIISVKASSDYGGLSSTNNVDGYYKIVDKGNDGTRNYLEIDLSNFTAAKKAAIVAYFTVEKFFTNAQFFPVFTEGTAYSHEIICTIDTNSLAPMGIEAWQIFRYVHMLFLPVQSWQGAQTPTVAFSWNCNHYYKATPSTKSFQPVAINAREISTQVVMDLYSQEMSAEGQGLQINIQYNQLIGRWTLYTLALFYSPRGLMNLQQYQRPNS